jgi:hypothetical protein
MFGFPALWNNHLLNTRTDKESPTRSTWGPTTAAAMSVPSAVVLGAFTVVSLVLMSLLAGGLNESMLTRRRDIHDCAYIPRLTV